MHLGSESVELLEAHDQRPPRVRVDAVTRSRQPDLFVHVHPLDPDFERHDAASLRLVVLRHQMLCLDDGFHDHRALGDSGRRHSFGRGRGEPGQVELVRLEPVATVDLAGRNGILACGQRQPINGGSE